MRRITTIRHATTANAVRHVICGRLDEPLSDEGVAETRTLLERCGPLDADLVISSPLRRATQTAEILTGRPLHVVDLDPQCMERDYGVLQGLEPSAAAEWASQIHYVEAGGIAHSFDPPGGETLLDVQRRAARFAARIVASDVATILVFSHQCFLQFLQAALLGEELEDALTRDIAVLQIDEFVVSDDGPPATHRQLHEGNRGVRSW